jgi:mono/diheme cytochrome c family protein
MPPRASRCGSPTAAPIATARSARGGGGRAAGLRIAQQPIPFAAFRNQLRRPADEMPPYVEAVLSDQDVADIFAYIRALPPPPDLKTIGILAN